MKRTTVFAAVALSAFAAVSLTAVSCGPKKDKYYYAHEAVDLQKEYDRARENGDAAKMTEVNRLIKLNKENYDNCVALENEKKAAETAGKLREMNSDSSR